MESRILNKGEMANRHWLAVFALTALMLILCQEALAEPVPGENVNMVAGPVSGLGEPLFPITGDPFLQRQNEPSCDVSTRNPLHIFCGSNDYRTVDVAGILGGSLVGVAGLGTCWSNNAGRPFRSSFLPGFPGAPDPARPASPV